MHKYLCYSVMSCRWFAIEQRTLNELNGEPQIMVPSDQNMPRKCVQDCFKDSWGELWVFGHAF